MSLVSHSSHSSGRSECPCKRIPWSLSSFTAAEYGDVHSLMQKHSSRDPARWSKPDSAGYTPLHLAAQHNHVTATSWLLQQGCPADGIAQTVDPSGSKSQSSFATPLHRASFAGAIGTMTLLLQAGADWKTPDGSFGDLRTPLHKAAAGGRYLAVQLLLNTIQAEENDTIILCALELKDASGLTALQVAEDYAGRNIKDERDSVVRWDQVAGGVADWEKCVALLQRQADQLEKRQWKNSMTPSFLLTQTASPMCIPVSPRTVLPSLPSYLTTNKFDCFNCSTEDGYCRTASWQAAFMAALSTSVDDVCKPQITLAGQPSVDVNDSIDDPESQLDSSAKEPPEIRQKNTDEKGHPTVNQSKKSKGICCRACSKPTISLYPSAQGLICKFCLLQ